MIDIEKNNEIDVFCNSFNDQFQNFYLGSNEEKINGILKKLKNQDSDKISIENFKRQYYTTFLKEISLMVRNNELDHRDFDLEALKKVKLWKPFAKIILLKRIDELKNAQVEKKGKKYYVKDLKDTYFGNYILERLKFTRRTVLDEEEYDKVIAAIKKLNYEVPIVVKPTETELFFKK